MEDASFPDRLHVPPSSLLLVVDVGDGVGVAPLVPAFLVILFPLSPMVLNMKLMKRFGYCPSAHLKCALMRTNCASY